MRKLAGKKADPVVVKIGNTYNDPKHMEILVYSDIWVDNLYDLYPDAAIGSVAYMADGSHRWVLDVTGDWVESVTYVGTYTELNPK